MYAGSPSRTPMLSSSTSRAGAPHTLPESVRTTVVSPTISVVDSSGPLGAPTPVPQEASSGSADANSACATRRVGGGPDACPAAASLATRAPPFRAAPIGCTVGLTSHALHVGAPDELVQLNLHADGEAAAQDPARERLEVEVAPDR